MKTIAFCGIDGSGKTTQINNIKRILEENGSGVYVAKVPFFPFHNYIDGNITQFDIRINMAFTFAKYYIELLPKLENEGYDYILCDRHYLCHLAFAMTYGINKKELNKLLSIFSLAGPPDCVIYFDIPLNIAIDRINSRVSKSADKDEVPEILGPTLENYDKLLALSTLGFKNVIRIDATNSPNEITKRIINTILVEIKK